MEGEPVPARAPIPGDHIFCWKPGYTYSHHGIFMENGEVVHLNPELTRKSNCTKCPPEKDNKFTRRTCLNCFTGGAVIKIYQYSVSPLEAIKCFRSGQCTVAASDPPEDVLRRAEELLRLGNEIDGSYNLSTNNCEIFSLYCKTGKTVESRVNVGQMGQITSLGAMSVMCYCSPSFRQIAMNHPVKILAGCYGISMVILDIGLRPDATKISVPDRRKAKTKPKPKASPMPKLKVPQRFPKSEEEDLMKLLDYLDI